MSLALTKFSTVSSMRKKKKKKLPETSQEAHLFLWTTSELQTELQMYLRSEQYCHVKAIIISEPSNKRTLGGGKKKKKKDNEGGLHRNCKEQQLRRKFFMA